MWATGMAVPPSSAGNPPTPITQETATHVTMVSFTTDSDPTAIPGKSPAFGPPILPKGSIFAIQVDPVSGVETPVPFPNGNGATNPDFAIDDPVRGRLLWRTAKNFNPLDPNKVVSPG